jgi:hypothetical protein
LRKIIIALPEELFSELEAASAEHREMGFGPGQWAEEAVASALASRRLPNVHPSPQCGRHNHGGASGRELVTEPEGYRVRWPEGISGGETEVEL